MKLRLLEYVRCPACRASLHLVDPVIQDNARAAARELPPCSGRCPFPEVTGLARDCSACVTHEVLDGALSCEACGARYAILEGIPRLHEAAGEGWRMSDPSTRRTAASFGYLWEQSTLRAAALGTPADHYGVMERRLELEPPRGLVLDAGCGTGADLANQAERPGVEAIGVELSDGGSRASFARTLPLARAHVVQADLRRLPFDENCFDLAYSYGVLHHLRAPADGLREIVRVVKGGGRVVAYLYEHFRERAAVWRWLLAAANALRGATTAMPHRVLYRLCQVAGPLVYLVFVVPFSLGRHVPGVAAITASFPFRHATGPFSLTGELYDRFSAPVECRYTRQSALDFFKAGGLERLAIGRERGWVVQGIKPTNRRPTAPQPSIPQIS